MFFFFICIVFPGCDSKKPVKIGFIAGTSGHVADMGIEALEAVQLAVEEWNKKGGINGNEIQLSVKNDRQDPEIAAHEIQKLINEKVAAVIGPLTSDMGMVAIPLLNKEQIVSISPTISTDKLSGIDDFFFRIIPTVRKRAAVSAGYQIKTGNMTRIAAVYDAGNSSSTGDWLDHFKELFIGQDREVVTTISFKSNEYSSFSDIAGKALSHNIDGILIIASSIDSALLCQQIRKIDKNIRITVSDCSIDHLIELGGKAVEGITVVKVYSPDNPAYQRFRKSYLRSCGREPGFIGLYTYNASNILFTSLKAQKKGQDLKHSILSIREFDGLSKKIKFDDFGDVNQSDAFMAIIQDQKIIPVE